MFGRVLKVDHTRYKRKEDEQTGDNTNGFDDGDANADGIEKPARDNGTTKESLEERPMLQEERELAHIIEHHDDNDPMKEYLIQQKREELNAALVEFNKEKASHSRTKSRTHKHRQPRLEKWSNDDNIGKTTSASKRSKRRRTRSESVLSNGESDGAQQSRR